ncbi:hypothetical protein AOLI_G00003700 [Acnodon oligacanthus]
MMMATSAGSNSQTPPPGPCPLFHSAMFNKGSTQGATCMPKPRGELQYTEIVSNAEVEAIKTLIDLHLASWWELQAAFHYTEK